MASNRIHRQTLIKDWDQDKLEALLLLNLGNGLSARYVTLLASCLEIGRVIYLTGERTKTRQEFLGSNLRRGEVAPQVAEIIKDLNPFANITGYYGNIRTRVVSHLVDYQASIFHSGNDWNEKRHILTEMVCSSDFFDEDKKHPSVVLSAGNDHELRLADYRKERITPAYLMPQFRRERPSLRTAIAQASIGLAEIVRETIGFGEPLEGVLTYNLQSDKRLSHQEDFDWTSFDPTDKKILVVGMGAIGGIYLEATQDLGFNTVYLCDKDNWEITNFSRAPQFAGKTGLSKAHSAKKHYSKTNQCSRYVSRRTEFTEESSFPRVDLIISAVDGFDNQMRIINYSQRNQIPLLLGGCTPFSCAVYSYVPKKTSSMLYQYDFLKQAYLDSIRQVHRHCTDPDVQASQVLTTALCASILAGETINLFCNRPLQGPFMYNMLTNPRFEYIPQNQIKDLGTNVPRYTPLERSCVERIINHNVEEIHVNGTAFERWYEQNGNILNQIGVRK